MAKKTLSIDKWCPYFIPFYSILKTKAVAHLDCLDCAVYQTNECRYMEDSDNINCE